MRSLFFLFFVCVLGGTLFVQYHTFERPHGVEEFVVQQGESFSTIVTHLAEQNIVPQAWLFESYAKLTADPTKIQAGRYTLPQTLSFPILRDTLMSKPEPAHKIVLTFREGLSIEEIIAVITQNTNLSRDDVIRCLETCKLRDTFDFIPTTTQSWRDFEWYLYPETYFFRSDVDAKTILTTMIGTFQTRVLQKIVAKSWFQGTKEDIQRYVILASLIEKESRNSEERPIISGIIQNRLRDTMPLGIDATTRYETNNWTEPLTTEDFQSSSPYNTRKKTGLPPTAISSFSDNSFRAAMMPTASEYLYYLHDDEGVIHYAKTYDEHRKNIQNYLHQ